MDLTNGNLDKITNDRLRQMMYNIDGIVKFRERVNDMTRAGDEIALEVGSWFIPTGWLLKARYLRFATKIFKLKRGITLLRNFSKLERGIIKEAMKILNSPQMKTLEKAFREGVEAEVQIGERTICYSPDLAASAITSHSEKGFIFGREAFSSTKELGSTVLHELYRLGTQSTGELSVDMARPYTNAALDFSKKAISFLDF